MVSTVAETADACAQAIALVERALHPVLAQGRPVPPSTEASIQKALSLLRRQGGNADLLKRVEQVSTSLFTISRAEFNGRLNLYESQMLRLKRMQAQICGC